MLDFNADENVMGIEAVGQQEFSIRELSSKHWSKPVTPCSIKPATLPPICNPPEVKPRQGIRISAHNLFPNKSA